jgi:hypothetical protein
MTRRTILNQLNQVELTLEMLLPGPLDTRLDLWLRTARHMRCLVNAEVDIGKAKARDIRGERDNSLEPRHLVDPDVKDE